MNAPAPRPLRIGLLWHSLASGNLGVVALTESHMALVAAEAQALGAACRFILIGGGQPVPQASAAAWSAAGQAVESRALRLLRPGIARRIGDCDAVFDIGEGDSFATLYGLRRFLYFWLAKQRVLACGLPLTLSPQTIGPFDSALARTLARHAMRRADRVFARDALSTRLLHDMGLAEQADEATDVAFALPFTRQPLGPPGVTRVGLNVSGLLWSGGYTGGNQFGLAADYRRVMTRLAQALAALPGVELHLVSHVIEPARPVEDDVAAAMALAAAVPAARVVPAFVGPGQAKSYIAGLDFFAGARMHACIAALSAGVPVVPMAYSRKFSGLFGTLGYGQTADLRRLGEDEAVATVLHGFHERSRLQREVAQARAEVEARLARYRRHVRAVLQRALHAAR